ncbi:MAG: FAD-dependent oxidoreductase [Clostridia bacterium]|nr:FAD-dependent oxidoreductase [Clostridia bacterium]
MKTFVLDGAKMTDRASAHRQIAEKLRFPEWYGANLDALADCLSEFPSESTVWFIHTADAVKSLGSYGEKILETFERVSEEAGFTFQRSEKEESLEYSRDVPLRGSYEVIVCGSGPAGWIAAVAAARAGISTALVDRLGFVGGTATSGYVLPISGFYFKGIRVASGIPFEFAKRMEDAGAAIFEMPKGNISYDPEYYKLEAAEMLAEAGVERISNAEICDCLKGSGGEIKTIIIHTKNGFEALSADIFIDATGDADLCAFAGLPMQPENPNPQPLSTCFLLSGVDVTTPLLRDSIHHNEGKSQNDEIREYLLSCEGLEEFCGPWFNTAVCGDLVAVNVTRAGCDALDNREYGVAEERLRRDMWKIVGLLRAKYREFENCSIVSSAHSAGIRETRRILGKYTFTGDDLLSGRKLPCPVAVCAHPVDIHLASGAGQKLIRLETPAALPYDSMVFDNCPNVIVAGRCVSADPVAFASLRVQGTCMTVGEAAGAAAVYSIRTGVPANELSDNGFYLDPYEFFNR